MDKFGRNYFLSVYPAKQVGQPDGVPLTITLPITLELDITRNTLSSMSVASLRLYNLAENTRNSLRFNISDIGTYRKIVLQAGYGDNPPVVFTGNLSQGWSVREGVNFVTTLESYDGGFAANKSSTELPVVSGTSTKAFYKTLLGDLDFVSVGAIGPSFYTDPATGKTTSFTRANTYNGGTVNIIREETNSGFFIDLQKAHLLSNNEYINETSPVTISSASGLLSTPVLEETIVKFDMIFEASLKPGYSAFLDSSTGAAFNGRYRITGVKHRGMISAAVCGDLITTGEFFYSKILNGVNLS